MYGRFKQGMAVDEQCFCSASQGYRSLRSLHAASGIKESQMKHTFLERLAAFYLLFACLTLSVLIFRIFLSMDKANELVELIKNCVNIVFFLAIPYIAWKTFSQAQKTVFVSQRSKALEHQLEEFKSLSSLLFFKEEDDFIRTLNIYDAAFLTARDIYSNYLNYQKKENQELLDVIKKSDVVFSKFIVMERGLGAMSNSNHIAYKKYFERGIETEAERAKFFASLSEEEKKEAREALKGQQNQLPDMVELNYINISKNYDANRDELIRLSESIFIRDSLQTLIIDFVKALDKCNDYLFKGAQEAGEKVHSIDSQEHGLKLPMSMKLSSLSAKILGPLRCSGHLAEMKKLAIEIKADMKHQIKINKLLDE